KQGIRSFNLSLQPQAARTQPQRCDANSLSKGKRTFENACRTSERPPSKGAGAQEDLGQRYLLQWPKYGRVHRQTEEIPEGRSQDRNRKHPRKRFPIGSAGLIS